MTMRTALRPRAAQLLQARIGSGQVRRGPHVLDHALGGPLGLGGHIQRERVRHAPAPRGVARRPRGVGAGPHRQGAATHQLATAFHISSLTALDASRAGAAWRCLGGGGVPWRWRRGSGGGRAHLSRKAGCTNSSRLSSSSSRRAMATACRSAGQGDGEHVNAAQRCLPTAPPGLLQVGWRVALAAFAGAWLPGLAAGSAPQKDDKSDGRDRLRRAGAAAAPSPAGMLRGFNRNGHLISARRMPPAGQSAALCGVQPARPVVGKNGPAAPLPTWPQHAP